MQKIFLRFYTKPSQIFDKILPSLLKNMQKPQLLTV